MSDELEVKKKVAHELIELGSLILTLAVITAWQKLMLSPDPAGEVKARWEKLVKPLKSKAAEDQKAREDAEVRRFMKDVSDYDGSGGRDG